MNRLLSNLLRNNRPYARKTKGAAAILQLALVLLTIILVSFSKNAMFTYSLSAVIFLMTALSAPEDIKSIIKMVCPAVIMTLLIMLPSVFMGSPGTMLTVTLKVFVSVGMIALLNTNVTENDLTAALRSVHVPATFIMILDTAVRFLGILGRTAGALYEAVTLRTVSNRKWNKQATGGVLGTTYLMSEKMSEETAAAMHLRCFTGEYRTMRRHKINIFDILVPAFAAAEIWLFIITQKGINV